MFGDSPPRRLGSSLENLPASHFGTRANRPRFGESFRAGCARSALRFDERHYRRARSNWPRLRGEPRGRADDDANHRCGLGVNARARRLRVSERFRRRSLDADTPGRPASPGNWVTAGSIRSDARGRETVPRHLPQPAAAVSSPRGRDVRLQEEEVRARTPRSAAESRERASPGTNAPAGRASRNSPRIVRMRTKSDRATTPPTLPARHPDQPRPLTPSLIPQRCHRGGRDRLRRGSLRAHRGDPRR